MVRRKWVDDKKFLDIMGAVNLIPGTNAQLVDAIAVAGQKTPGPVFNSAAFVGYLLGGWPSALLAATGIFLPSFILMGLLCRFLPAMRRSGLAGSFLDGINAASLGLMAAVSIQLGLTFLLKMYTLGHGFVPPGIRAGDMRYHGISP
jgi:chromate transporter